jgi:hypothetical protein
MNLAEISNKRSKVSGWTLGAATPLIGQKSERQYHVVPIANLRASV